MDVTAVAKGVTMSPRKVGEVVALVRNQTPQNAVVILEHTPRRAALPVKKVIQSAVANAVNNHKLDEQSLRITTIQVGTGTMLKRFRPVAFGRAHPYRKRTSNIRVVVSGTVKAAPAKKKSSTAKKATAKKETA